MSLDVRHCVSGQVTTTDTDLLDAIEAELPNADEQLMGAEYHAQREENDDGSETLSARMTFAPDDTTTERDGQVITPADAAAALYQQVITHDLADRAEEWRVRHYRTPEGGVTPDAVQEWYEAHPDAQPLDEGGKPIIPQTWDPTRHTIADHEG